MGLEDVFENVKTFTKEQLSKRETRLKDPAFQLELKNLKDSAKKDFTDACKTGLSSAYHLTFGPFIKFTGESYKELAKQKAKIKKKGKKGGKISNSKILGAGISAGIWEIGKGGIDMVKFVGNLGLVLGKGTVLGTRYLIAH